MSQSQPSPTAGRGIMRSLAKGASASGFSQVFVMTDLVFHPSQAAARVHREEARRRKVAVPAPGEPPRGDDEPPDAATAIPAFLFEPPDEPPDELPDELPDDRPDTGPRAAEPGDEPDAEPDAGLS